MSWNMNAFVPESQNQFLCRWEAEPVQLHFFERSNWNVVTFKVLETETRHPGGNPHFMLYFIYLFFNGKTSSLEKAHIQEIIKNTNLKINNLKESNISHKLWAFFSSKHSTDRKIQVSRDHNIISHLFVDPWNKKQLQTETERTVKMWRWQSALWTKVHKGDLFE